ncbi:MAG: hypothetical protein ACREQ4_08745 [Candidatus Binataceae bacterium]
MSLDARARAESPNAPPIWYEDGLVPIEKARKLTAEQAALLRSSGRYIAPARVQGETPGN